MPDGLRPSLNGSIVGKTMRRLAGIGLFVMMMSTRSTADGQPSAPRKVKFTSGESIIESGAEKDHVVVKDAQGRKTSESWCGSGEFDAYLALFTKLRETIGTGDRTTVAKLVAYPLRVNAKRPLTLRDEAALAKAYDKVFTTQVSEKIRKAEPAAVFCRDGQGMLGDGVVWAAVSARTAKAVVVNQ